MNECPFCTAKNLDDDKICQYCGSKLNSKTEQKFGKSLIKLIKYLFTSKGRICLSEFWVIQLIFIFLLLISGILSLAIEVLTNNESNVNMFFVIFFTDLFFVILILWIISNPFVLIRRFHDLGVSGWTLIGLFIPILNVYLLIKIYLFRGVEIDNDYGPPSSFCFTEISIFKKINPKVINFLLSVILVSLIFTWISVLFMFLNSILSLYGLTESFSDESNSDVFMSLISLLLFSSLLYFYLKKIRKRFNSSLLLGVSIIFIAIAFPVLFYFRDILYHFSIIFLSILLVVFGFFIIHRKDLFDPSSTIKHENDISVQIQKTNSKTK